MSKAVKLGEIGNFVSGGTPSRKHPEYFEGSIPWVSTPALNGGMIDEADAVQMITEQAIASSATKLLPPRSLLIGVRVGVGKTAVNLVPMCTNQDIVAITGVDESLWDIRYVSYAVQAKSSYLVSQKQGATITGITSKLLKGVEIQQRSIEDQRCCVRMLDSVKDRIKDASDGIEKLDELVKSRFVEMFGDPIENPKQLPIMRIDEIADVQTGATPLRSNAAYYGGSIPWVKTGEVAAGLLEEAEETITELALQETNCKLFPAGTILVAMYGQGDTRGKAAILRYAAATNQACAAILLNEEYDADFILAQLNLRYKDLRSRSLGGNQQNLSLKIIKAYELIVPSTEQQREFMAFVQQIDKLKFDYQNN
ncbi:MAG: restriction endonuclease subunit S [Atopobiaceae bacterium]|nr:restriction endonuclease subunit S [Atopobiaceae bacterium]